MTAPFHPTPWQEGYRVQLHEMLDDPARVFTHVWWQAPHRQGKTRLLHEVRNERPPGQVVVVDLAWATTPGHLLLSLSWELGLPTNPAMSTHGLGRRATSALIASGARLPAIDDAQALLEARADRHMALVDLLRALGSRAQLTVLLSSSQPLHSVPGFAQLRQAMPLEIAEWTVPGRRGSATPITPGNEQEVRAYLGALAGRLALGAAQGQVFVNDKTLARLDEVTTLPGPLLLACARPVVVRVATALINAGLPFAERQRLLRFDILSANTWGCLHVASS